MKHPFQYAPSLLRTTSFSVLNHFFARIIQDIELSRYLHVFSSGDVGFLAQSYHSVKLKCVY